MHIRQLSPRSVKKIEENQIAKMEPREYKVVVIGDGGVGKTALTMQYVSNMFLDFHDPTIEDAFQTQAVIDGEPGIIDILDTAGQEDLQTAINEQYLKHGEAYIGVYSINDKVSFTRLRSRLQALTRLRNTDDIPMVIVANKLDLFNERQVSTMEGVALAREFDSPFYEASAANRINVEDAFNSLIRQIRKKEESDEEMNKMNVKKPKLKRFRKYVTKKIHNGFNQLNVVMS